MAFRSGALDWAGSAAENPRYSFSHEPFAASALACGAVGAAATATASARSKGPKPR